MPAGPSGSPLRGLINVLPTGRNFYSVDPKAIPSRMAFQTGQAMANPCCGGIWTRRGDYPQSVGLSVWGTSAMRTSGDDIAEVLALLGVMPVWTTRLAASSGWRQSISPSWAATNRRDGSHLGLLRDAFPHVLTMLDDAVRLVADLDEPGHLNFVRQHTR